MNPTRLSRIDMPLPVKVSSERDSYSLAPDKFIPNLNHSYKSLRSQQENVQYWYKLYQKRFEREQELILTTDQTSD